MSDIQFSPRAYTKMILHASKYPHLAVNGVLLAEKDKSGKSLQIVDAVPLFHQCLYVTPMAEVALVQVSDYIDPRIRFRIYRMYSLARSMRLPPSRGNTLPDTMWRRRISATTALSERPAIRWPTRLPSICPTLASLW